MEHVEWAECLNVMRELWCDWTPGEAELVVWKREFGQKRKDWFVEALYESKANCRFRSPDIPMVRKHFTNVRAAESYHLSPAEERATRRESDEQERALIAMEVDEARRWAATLDPDRKRSLWEQFKAHPCYKVLTDGTDTQLMVFQAFVEAR